MAPISQTSCASRSTSCAPWKYSLPFIVALFCMVAALCTPADAQRGSDHFISPTESSTWFLGDTVNIRFRRALSKYDSNNTMLYLEYTTQACQGSRPDEERICDNRATKVSALGQIQTGADSFQWTIPTTLDLQLSRGKFHLYDYNGHTSESFTILPAPRRYPRFGLVDQADMF